MGKKDRLQVSPAANNRQQNAQHQNKQKISHKRDTKVAKTQANQAPNVPAQPTVNRPGPSGRQTISKRKAILAALLVFGGGLAIEKVADYLDDGEINWSPIPNAGHYLQNIGNSQKDDAINLVEVANGKYVVARDSAERTTLNTTSVKNMLVESTAVADNFNGSYDIANASIAQLEEYLAQPSQITASVSENLSALAGLLGEDIADVNASELAKINSKVNNLTYLKSEASALKDLFSATHSVVTERTIYAVDDALEIYKQVVGFKENIEAQKLILTINRDLFNDYKSNMAVLEDLVSPELVAKAEAQMNYVESTHEKYEQAINNLDRMLTRFVKEQQNDHNNLKVFNTIARSADYQVKSLERNITAMEQAIQDGQQVALDWHDYARVDTFNQSEFSSRYDALDEWQQSVVLDKYQKDDLTDGKGLDITKVEVITPNDTSKPTAANFYFNDGSVANVQYTDDNGKNAVAELAGE